MASLKRCIINKCKECIYDPIAKGSWRKQVENCTSYTCPLYEVRPLTSKRREKEDEIEVLNIEEEGTI